MDNVIQKRLYMLRSAMSERSISAYIIPGTDPHQSEYCADCWKLREWITGFNGSAGTAVITTDQAGLWTDSRYFLQAEQQLAGSTVNLFKQGLASTPSIREWLAQTLPAGSTVAIDGALFSSAEAQQLKAFFEQKGFSFVADFDPFDKIWSDRPPIPTHPFFEQPVAFCGKSIEDKLDEIEEGLRKSGANTLLLSALDEIAWALNIRGTDVESNPVGICYALITPKECILFANAEKIDPAMADYLAKNHIRVVDYNKIYDFLKSLETDHRVQLDPNKVNYNLSNAVPSHCEKILSTSPIPMLKSVKNKTEIAGFHKAMIKDGVALVRFMRWLEQALDKEVVMETTIGEKLIEFRSEQDLYVGESFSTIAGFNAHGAIVHYRATPESASRITRDGFLLIDSGAQYFDGTTDITRTLALGDLSDRQKRDYTLVLKGHIAIATCRFPAGTRGAQLDVLARKSLWEYGLNYLHGTGHGIGHFLNVHEGPQSIRLEENPTPLMPGMVTSNEPGVYLTDQYGIRLENLILTTMDQTTEFGDFYKFETLTLFPFDKRAIDTSLLSRVELNWLNDYHKQVYETLSPVLQDDEKAWLKEATTPLK